MRHRFTLSRIRGTLSTRNRLQITMMGNISQLTVATIRVNRGFLRTPNTSININRRIQRTNSTLTFRHRLTRNFTTKNISHHISQPTITTRVTRQPLIRTVILNRARRHILHRIHSNSKHTILLRVHQTNSSIRQTTARQAHIRHQINRHTSTGNSINTLFRRIGSRVITIRFRLSIQMRPTRLISMQRSNIRRRKQHNISTRTPKENLLTKVRTFFRLIRLVRGPLNILRRVLTLLHRIRTPHNTISRHNIRLNFRTQRHTASHQEHLPSLLNNNKGQPTFGRTSRGLRFVKSNFRIDPLSVILHGSAITGNGCPSIVTPRSL